MTACVLGAHGFSGLCQAQEDNALKLWYRQAAAQWVQALPIGNGRLAAMVFGDVRKEHVQLNEDTVWSGDKRDRSNARPRTVVTPEQIYSMYSRAWIPRATPGRTFIG